MKRKAKAKDEAIVQVTLTWELPVTQAKKLVLLYIGKRKARKARGK